jgi:hypothetical protein
MLKKTMTYTDYDGVTRTEDFHFNLSKAEVMEMQLGTAGGMEKMLQRIVSEKDQPEIIKLFKDIILRSYGKKSPDGKRFIKSKELCEEFAQTEAFSDLFVLLGTDSDAAAEFVNGVLPHDLVQNATSGAVDIALMPPVAAQ